MQGSIKIETGEKKTDWCKYFNDAVKELNTQKWHRYWGGAGEIYRGGEGNQWVEIGWLRINREQKRETMDKTALCYHILFIQASNRELVILTNKCLYHTKKNLLCHKQNHHFIMVCIGSNHWKSLDSQKYDSYVKGQIFPKCVGT